MDTEEWGLDGSSIPKSLLKFMLDRVEINSKVLELGSGKGTEKLAKYFKMTSIEHSAKYLNMYDSDYIYAPLKKMDLPEFPEENYWYDPFFIKDKLETLDYSFILVDGPIGGENGGRSGFYYNYNLFKRVPLIIDDLHRPAERRMFDLLVKLLDPKESQIVTYPFENKTCSFGFINP